MVDLGYIGLTWDLARAVDDNGYKEVMMGLIQDMRETDSQLNRLARRQVLKTIEEESLLDGVHEWFEDSASSDELRVRAALHLNSYSAGQLPDREILDLLIAVQEGTEVGKPDTEREWDVSAGLRYRVGLVFQRCTSYMMQLSRVSYPQ